MIIVKFEHSKTLLSEIFYYPAVDFVANPLFFTDPQSTFALGLLFKFNVFIPKGYPTGREKLLGYYDGHSNIFLPAWLSLLPVYSHFLPLTSWKAEAPYLQGDGMIQY